MAKDSRNQDEFGEYLPAYASQVELFNDTAEPREDKQVHQAILKQLGWILLLLVAQIILFVILINNTLNLG